MFNKITIQGKTVRIASVVAFLLCSLLGRPLHELQHHESLEHPATEVPCVSSKATHAGHKCRGAAHSRHVNVFSCRTRVHSEGRGPDGDEPQDDHPVHSHDSHDCSVCQTLCVSATAPNCTSACLKPDVCVGRHLIFSESVADSVFQSADARGPPCVG